jgi:hypothetical protein
MLQIKVDGQIWDLPIESMRTKEAIKLQEHTNMTVKEIFEGAAKMDARALTALVWFAYTRGGHRVKYKDVDFDLMKLEMLDDSDKDSDESEEDDEGKENGTPE